MKASVWLSIKQLADLQGTYRKKALRWAKKNAKTRYFEGTNGGGSRGQIFQVALESLPQDLRKQYLSSYHEKPSGKLIPFGKSLQTVKAGNTQAADKPAPIKNMTPAQERTALARADLVNYVRGRKKAAKSGGQSKTRAAEATIELYNNGFILGDVFKSLGRVELKTLYRWDRALRQSGGDYSALAPHYGGNRGESKLTEIEREVFLKVLLQPNHPPVGTAIRVAREILRQRGLMSPASDASWRRFAEAYREQNHHIWTLAREGEKALNDKVLPYLERDSSMLEVGDVLVADGHTLNFQVLNPWTGKPCRAALVLFLDWASRYPCGYEIMLTEDVQCVHSALRRAILALGKVPGNVLLDNGKAFKARLFTSGVDFEQAGVFGLYGRLGIGVRFARPYNAQDKVVERFFRTFGDYVERLMPSYIGAGIGDKPAYMKRNEKFHKSMHNPAVPTIDQALELVARGVEFYASQPHSGLGGRLPSEVFARGVGAGVDRARLDYLMMSRDVRTIYRNGVRLLGGHYWNEALVGYKGRAIVKYDMHDLANVLVYGTDGEFLCQAGRVRQHDPLMRTGEDLSSLRRISRDKAAIKSTLKAAVRAVYGDVKKLPELDWQRAVDEVPGLPELLERESAEASAEGEPYFEQGWQRYEHLMEKKARTPEEEFWIEAYRRGAVCPGEYVAIYASQAVSAAGGEH